MFRYLRCKTRAKHHPSQWWIVAQHGSNFLKCESNCEPEVSRLPGALNYEPQLQRSRKKSISFRSKANMCRCVTLNWWIRARLRDGGSVSRLWRRWRFNWCRCWRETDGQTACLRLLCSMKMEETSAWFDRRRVVYRFLCPLFGLICVLLYSVNQI